MSGTEGDGIVQEHAEGLKPTESTRRTPGRRGGLGEFLARYGVIVTLAAIIVGFCLVKPHAFATTTNLQDVLSEIAPTAIMSFAVTVVLIMGDFDLSIVGMIGVANAVTVKLMASYGLAVPLVLVLAIVLGIIVGALNGGIIAGFAASSFIITLASGQVLSGIELQLTNGGQTIFEGIPSSYLSLTTSTPILGVQNAAWIALAVFGILWVLMEQTAAGRYMYAIGSNPEAARLSGIRVNELRIIGFIIVAVAGVVASVILVGQAGAYSNGLAATFLLPTYAAVFLGASVLRPGTFNLVGTLVGAVFLEVIANGLTILSLSNAVVSMVQGGLLVVAVLLSTLQRKRRA